MDPDRLRRLLARVRDRDLDLDDALRELKALPFAELPFAKIDHHRSVRCGFPEVIFCQSKSLEEIRRIAAAILEHSDTLLATRASREAFETIRGVSPQAVWHERARCVTVEAKPAPRRGFVMVVSAGTADLPVAEEARVTASMLGAHVETAYDAGVAGIHRLLHQTERLQTARAIVVAAGMEGALASVVGGLVEAPVIAVPTSVGYGASFGGLAPLLTMLNSCAAGVAVVNIDNGFGAGYLAGLINRMPGPGAAALEATPAAHSRPRRRSPPRKGALRVARRGKAR
jgi:hypothetical protein